MSCSGRAKLLVQVSFLLCFPRQKRTGWSHSCKGARQGRLLRCDDPPDAQETRPDEGGGEEKRGEEGASYGPEEKYPRQSGRDERTFQKCDDGVMCAALLHRRNRLYDLPHASRDDHKDPPEVPEQRPKHPSYPARRAPQRRLQLRSKLWPPAAPANAA